VETIEVSRAGGVVTITLNRPEKKNAMNRTMWSELRQTFTEITDSDDDRCVVVTGAGDAFCSGADLSTSGDGTPDRHQLHNMRWIGEVALGLHRLPQPTIAKVNGVAAGAGCSLALGCDLIVASDEARFSMIFARRGLSVDWGASWLLPRLVGLHKAKELAFFADILGAKEAQELGIVNRVVPADSLDAFVDDWAQKLAAGPPIALWQTKLLLNNGALTTMAQALDDEGYAQTVNFGTEDTPEAIRAFVEKREARFQGR
jgi:2-(1,2-epoxy-1,2-dihydrophenyl)acetyl-CoA isomerase